MEEMILLFAASYASIGFAFWGSEANNPIKACAAYRKSPMGHLLFLFILWPLQYIWNSPFAKGTAFVKAVFATATLSAMEIAAANFASDYIGDWSLLLSIVIGFFILTPMILGFYKVDM